MSAGDVGVLQARFDELKSRCSRARSRFRSLIADRTHVFHLAAQAGVRKSWGRDFQIYTTNNIEATQLLLEACIERPLERFVYSSSSSVYGDDAALPMREDALPQPVSPYGVSKLAAEQPLLSVLRELRRFRPSLYAISRSTDRGSVRTWVSTNSCAPQCVVSR